MMPFTSSQGPDVASNVLFENAQPTLQLVKSPQLNNRLWILPREPITPQLADSKHPDLHLLSVGEVSRGSNGLVVHMTGASRKQRHHV